MVSLVKTGVGDVLGISRDRHEDEVMNHEELDVWVCLCLCSVYVYCPVLVQVLVQL
jgi:hypothetical protein